MYQIDNFGPDQNQSKSTNMNGVNIGGGIGLEQSDSVGSNNNRKASTSNVMRRANILKKKINLTSFKRG